MDKFSEKSLIALGNFYVYGLIDPRTNQLFYIGKGKDNRVFEHEKESINSIDSDKLKLKTILEIKNAGLEVKKIIINSNLTEQEAFAAEASLINAFNFISGMNLTNIAAGHHSTEALTVEEFEQLHGAVPLQEKDIKHKILVIKINQLYKRGKTVDYVFGVYNSLIIAVYKPTKWFICKNAKDKLPRQDIVINGKTENRIFFEDTNFENRIPLDKNQLFYLNKSITELKINQSAQNPITYLYPTN